MSRMLIGLVILVAVLTSCSKEAVQRRLDELGNAEPVDIIIYPTVNVDGSINPIGGVLFF